MWRSSENIPQAHQDAHCCHLSEILIQQTFPPEEITTLRMALSGTLDEAELQNTLKRMRRKFARTLNLYNPDLYNQEALVHSQDKWTGDAKAVYEDYVNSLEAVYSNPNINQEDEGILDNMINTATTEFSTFLNRFYTKCSLVADDTSRDAFLPNALVCQ